MGVLTERMTTRKLCDVVRLASSLGFRAPFTCICTYMPAPAPWAGVKIAPLATHSQLQKVPRYRVLGPKPNDAPPTRPRDPGPGGNPTKPRPDTGRCPSWAPPQAPVSAGPAHHAGPRVRPHGAHTARSASPGLDRPQPGPTCAPWRPRGDSW